MTTFYSVLSHLVLGAQRNVDLSATGNALWADSLAVGSGQVPLTATLLTALTSYGANAVTALTGDGTASGPGSAAFTLATVNSSTSATGDASNVPTITANAKGLVTSITSTPVIAPAGTLSGTTLKSTVVNSSLTSVGTLTAGTWNATAIDIGYGGTGQATAAAAFAALSPMTTAGDIIYENATPAPARLGIGTNGQVLTVVSGLPAWAAATGGANPALSNLASVAINTSLLPGSDNSINLGSSALSWAAGTVRLLKDGSGVTAVDTFNRTLKDSAATTQLAWSTSGVNFSALTATTVPYLDASKNLISSSVTPTQLGYLSGTSGTTGTGNLVLAASPTISGTLAAATITASVGVSISGYLNMNGNTISNVGTGVSGTDAVNLNQLQNAMAGVQWRPEVDLYDNVHTTKPATTATQIDSVTVTTGMRVLFVNLGASNNQVWTASVSAGAITWTAALDNNRVSAAPVTGDSILVLSGTIWTESAFNYNGTSWVQFNGANQVQAGVALSKTGNTLDVKYDNATISINGSNQIFVPTSGIGTTQLAAASVTIAKLATITDGVTLDQAGSGSSLEIKAGGVGTTQLGAAAVTSAKVATGVFDQVTITGGAGIAAAVSYAPATKVSAVYGGAATLSANTTYALRWGIVSNSENANQLYKADWDSTSLDQFWAIGLFNAGTSTTTGSTITVTTNGPFTLGSSDTAISSAGRGRPVWLGAAGTYIDNASFSPVTKDASMKLGICNGATGTSIWVDIQLMGIN